MGGDGEAGGAAAAEKSGQPPQEEQMTPKQRKQLELVYLHCTVNMAVSILNFTTRSEILRDVLIKGGTSPSEVYKEVAWWMSAWTGGTALCEFFLNPTIGRLSDTYGRKPFMVLSPYAVIALKTWVLSSPSLTSLTVERIVCDGLRTLSGTTMGGAAMADLVPASQLSKGFSDMWSRMGIALVVSPLVASRLSARMSYKAAILLAVFQLATDQFMLEETLPKEKMKPFEGVATPFSLFKLFAKSRSLRLASVTMAIQNLLDPKILADPWIIFQLDTLKWSREFSQLYTAIIGAGLLVGSKLNRIGLDKLGLHAHTSACHAACITSNLLVGVFPSDFTQWLSGLVGFYGDQRTNGIKQIVTNLSARDGIAKGESSGLLANLRALMVVFGPAVFSTAYMAGVKAGVPGAPFIAVALICAAAEMSHRNLQADLERSI